MAMKVFKMDQTLPNQFALMIRVGTEAVGEYEEFDGGQTKERDADGEEWEGKGGKEGGRRGGGREGTERIKEEEGEGLKKGRGGEGEEITK